MEGEQRQAVVAIVRREDRVLVIERGPEAARSGYWAPLSGKIEPGEEQAAAVVRESQEEVGLSVVPRAKVWECDTDDGRYRLHWWVADAEPGEPVLDPGEVAAARWIEPARFGELSPVFDGDLEFFERVYPALTSRQNG